MSLLWPLDEGFSLDAMFLAILELCSGVRAPDRYAELRPVLLVCLEVADHHVVAGLELDTTALPLPSCIPLALVPPPCQLVLVERRQWLPLPQFAVLLRQVNRWLGKREEKFSVLFAHELEEVCGNF